jgi:hypothetical protein
MPLPSAVPIGVRECLNCDEEFPPAREGWQSLYCSLPCWRADNGGPGRRLTPVPDPAPEPLTGSDFAASSEDEKPEPVVSRLVVAGRERCGVCGTDHDVFLVRPEGR